MGARLRERRATRLATMAVVACCGVCLASACSSNGHSSEERAHPGSATTATAPLKGIPRSLLLEARPIGRGPRFHLPVTGTPVGPCEHHLGSRIGVHVELFAENQVVLVPAGVGTLPPRQYAEGRISGARCYGALVTLDPTGLLLVRPGSHLTVSDLFRSWGQPLWKTRLAAFTAPRGTQVQVFVDGRAWHGSAPGAVPLADHAEIVLEVGPHVPPHHSYTFPPGT